MVPFFSIDKLSGEEYIRVPTYELTLKTIRGGEIMKYDLIIVGGGIANAEDPVEAAKQCRDIVDAHTNA